MKADRLLLGAVSACFAFSLLAAQSVRADDKPVAMKRTHKEKDVRQYKDEIKASINGIDAVFSQTRKDTVEKVKENGDVTIKTEFSDPHLSVGGSDMEPPPSASLHITRDKMGKPLEYRLDAEHEEIFSLKIQRLRDSISGIFLPKDVVKENEAWETEIDNPAAKDKKFKIKTQYQGMEKVEGVELWKIKQTSEPDSDDAGSTMSYEATFWLDPKDGSLVKAEETWKDMPTNADFGKITYTHTLKAVKPEKPEKADKEAK